MVDESWQNLIKAMQYMSFKQGDKTDLQKVIDMAKTLDLNEYLDEGKQAFTDALAAAEVAQILQIRITRQLRQIRLRTTVRRRA